MIPGTTLSLQINQEFAKIGIETKRASLEIQQPRAELQINQTPPSMVIDQGPGTLQINSEDFRSALGIKSVFQMTSDIAFQSKQIALDAIGYLSEEGDQLARIEKGTTIADLALQRQELGPMPIDDVGPPAPIKMSYTPHPTTIDWKLGGADVSITPRYPNISFHDGSIDVYVAQKNWLQIDVKGQHMNMTF